MPASRSRVRGPALMAVAAFALHQLRYVLGPAPAAGPSDHAYIPVAATAVVLLFALAAGELALRLARARDDGAGEAEPRSFMAVWLASSAGLIAIFTGQELIESLLAGGPVVDPLAGGGLCVLPLALLLGALVALAVRWSGVAVLAAVRRRRYSRSRPVSAARPFCRPAAQAGSLLGLHLAGRAPPLPS